MGQVQSAFDPDNRRNRTSPVGYKEPPFPSLYNPSLDSTIQQRGWFLHDASAIWRFTFYWTLILLMGTFMACAILASLNLLISRLYSRASHHGEAGYGHGHGHGHARAASATHTQATISTASGAASSTRTGSRRKLSLYQMRKRPPLWLIVFIPITMAATAAFVALVSGTIVGFALAAVYAAAGFSMSTWVPFMWALIQVVVLIIASYSSLTRVL